MLRKAEATEVMTRAEVHERFRLFAQQARGTVPSELCEAVVPEPKAPEVVVRADPDTMSRAEVHDAWLGAADVQPFVAPRSAFACSSKPCSARAASATGIAP